VREKEEAQRISSEKLKVIQAEYHAKQRDFVLRMQQQEALSAHALQHHELQSPPAVMLVQPRNLEDGSSVVDEMDKTMQEEQGPQEADRDKFRIDDENLRRDDESLAKMQDDAAALFQDKQQLTEEGKIIVSADAANELRLEQLLLEEDKVRLEAETMAKINAEENFVWRLSVWLR
jgi:hypothetical protein